MGLCRDCNMCKYLSYCGAARNVSARMDLNDSNDINSMARQVSQGNRYLGINLTNIYNSSKPNTVEFRYFNSSLDPAQLQANIKIANGVMVASEKARVREGTESMRRRGQILMDQDVSLNVRVDRSNHNAVMKFVDLFFTRKKDKDCALKVYAKNTWRN